MNTEITGLPVIRHNNDRQLVNARELHQFLESKQQFADWIKNRLEKYNFVENEDYFTFSQSYEKPQGGRPSIEYGLTLDVAKELCMLENNEKGRIARRYFIEKEKEAKGFNLANLSRLDMARMILKAEEEKAAIREELNERQKEVNRLTPAYDFAKTVLNADELVDIGQAAKLLQLPYGRNKLFKQLRAIGILFGEANEPKQNLIDKGYFKLKEQAVPLPGGKTKVYIQVYVTQRGLAYLWKRLKQQPAPAEFYAEN